MKKTMVLSGIVLALCLTFVGCEDATSASDSWTPEPLPPLTGTVNITGNLWVGQVLSVDVSGLGGDTGVISYRWNDVAGLGVTSSTYTTVVGDAGNQITVTVTRSGFSGNVTSAPVTIAATAPEFTVPGDNLAERFAWLRENAESNRPYLVTIGANETLSPAQAALPTSVSGVTITLRGSGVGERTVTLSENGNLFTLGFGITLVLDNNVTLHGTATNNNHLVRINSGGTLVMNSGSAITGNTNTSTVAADAGGGVRVNGGGTFTMNGGRVSGNAATPATGTNGNGGGVFIASGSPGAVFNMGGGEISDNDAGNDGGGVFIAWAGTGGRTGTFTMGGGTIFENSAGGDGGGVFVGDGTLDGAGFVMEGGTIRDNSAVLDGGGVGLATGVFGRAEFDMNAGQISDNTAGGTGGGVNVGSRGIFNMRGGTIAGNGASSGGGVFVAMTVMGFEGGRFQISSGTINGGTGTNANTAATGAALHLGGTGAVGQRGTFAATGAFSSLGTLSTTNDTIQVANGVLQ